MITENLNSKKVSGTRDSTNDNFVEGNSLLKGNITRTLGHLGVPE